MTKKISIKAFTPALQRAIHREVSSLKNSKRVLSKTELSDEAKAFLDKVVEGTWTQREDGKIDVAGGVNAWNSKVIHLFMGKEIFFGKVTNSFNCANNFHGGNIKITSLEGAPEAVGGNFNCSFAKITSLEGAPREVGGYFDCSATKITSLKGAPRVVGGTFNCTKTLIPSLIGSPKEVGGSFYCSGTNITSLEGAPETISETFDCSFTNITTLEGAPERVGGDFYCHYTKITSLKGAPKVVGGDFGCSDTKITSLEGAPEKVGGNFICRYTKITSLDGIGKVGGIVISDIKEDVTSEIEEDNDDDEVYGQLEGALYDLIDDTAKFYTLDEDENISRNTAKIKAYIKSKLFSKVTSIKGLEVFLANSKFAIRSALDGAASSESVSMVDDENHTDFLEDIKEAARKRINKLKS